MTTPPKRKVLSTVAVSALAFGLMAASGQAAEYEGTAYVAGMGGHFAKAVFTVDPDAAQPITIRELDKVDIGTGASHPTHDARIDARDRNTMYWSTYKLDPAADNMTHVGATDLRTGDVLIDVTLPTPERVVITSKMYCASGQTPEYFLPISMSNPGYIDVIRKSDMKRLHTVFLEGTDADPKVPYKYLHGTTTPDMSRMLITINESDSSSVNSYGTTIGKMHMALLDTEALTQGKVKVVARGVADGNHKSTISFRQYFSSDGKYIANATGDILYIIDAATLKVIDAETVGPLEQLHDALFTPDGRYVIATSRSKSVFPDCADPIHPKPDEYLMDGHLKLYDMQAKRFVGKSTSTCLSCHDEMLGRGEDAVHAVLCGIDVNWGNVKIAQK